MRCYKPEDRNARKPTWSPRSPFGRWRSFNYEELNSRDKCNLDLFWLDENEDDVSFDTTSPNELAAEIMEDLQAALYQLSEITADLGDFE